MLAISDHLNGMMHVNDYTEFHISCSEEFQKEIAWHVYQRQTDLLLQILNTACTFWTATVWLNDLEEGADYISDLKFTQ